MCIPSSPIRAAYQVDFSTRKNPLVDDTNKRERPSRLPGLLSTITIVVLFTALYWQGVGHSGITCLANTFEHSSSGCSSTLGSAQVLSA